MSPNEMTQPPLTLNAWMRWDLIEPIVATAAPTSILEFGPGSGTIAARMAAHAKEYVGMEPDAANRAIAATVLPAHARLVDSLDAVSDRTFDLVAAFEVLEHLEDDRFHLSEWVDRCTPGGTVIVSVPAHQHRFGPHDTWAGHLRRYSREDLHALASECGLVDVRVDVCGGPLGYALEFARNTLARRHLRSMADASETEIERRTATSARTRQTPAWLGNATRLVTFPFRLVQRPLRQSKMGTGFVVSGQRAR